MGVMSVLCMLAMWRTHEDCDHPFGLPKGDIGRYPFDSPGSLEGTDCPGYYKLTVRLKLHAGARTLHMEAGSGSPLHLLRTRHTLHISHHTKGVGAVEFCCLCVFSPLLTPSLLSGSLTKTTRVLFMNLFECCLFPHHPK